MKWYVAFLDSNKEPIAIAGSIWALSRETRSDARAAGKAWQETMPDVHGIRVEKRG